MLAEFMALLDPVNALADKAPGFVWRLQTEDDRVRLQLQVAIRGSPIRALVQRVSEAAVDVASERVAAIGPGLLVEG